MDRSTLAGPLINQRAREGMKRASADAAPEAFYVGPALVRTPGQRDVVREKTFAPVLHVLTYDDLDEAIALHNAVPQGLFSSICTGDHQRAEIGGAFGGEKETGGGRGVGLGRVAQPPAARHQHREPLRRLPTPVRSGSPGAA
jgi:aldehyde dehydrogenase (NAD+)